MVPFGYHHLGVYHYHFECNLVPTRSIHSVRRVSVFRIRREFSGFPASVGRYIIQTPSTLGLPLHDVSSHGPWHYLPGAGKTRR